MVKKDQLIEKAKEARKYSYSPYSNFAVGAALLCKDGSIFIGANIENSSFGLTMCAERNAIFQAYINGKQKKDIVALAIIADTKTPVSPCGACRQVMSELLNESVSIYLSNLKGDIAETNIKQLLPYAFVKEDLQN
ncbi:MAG: cytidine deaminase [Bacilli bacterium]|nr:cytidine deaminase [Bacilli bacterium]